MIHHGSIVEGHPKLTPGRRRVLRALDHGLTVAAIGTCVSGLACLSTGLGSLGCKVLTQVTPEQMGIYAQAAAEGLGWSTRTGALTMIFTLGLANFFQLLHRSVTATLYPPMSAE